MATKMKATADLQGAFGATFTTEETYDLKADALSELKTWVMNDLRPLKADSITSLTITFEEV